MTPMTHQKLETILSTWFSTLRRSIERRVETQLDDTPTTVTLTLKCKFDTNRGDAELSAEADIYVRNGNWKSHDVEARFLEDAVDEAFHRHLRDRALKPLSLPRVTDTDAA